MIPDVSLSGIKASEAADPKAVAAKVQGMFTEIMLKAMEDSVDAEDGLFGGSASSDIYRGMMREQLASAVAAHLKSPLEGQINRAFHKSSSAGSNQESNNGDRSNDVSDLPVSGIISSPKGWRRDPINGESRYHAGTDIAAPAGTPIRAVAEGRVVESGSKSGYGNTVVIETGDGHKMLYAHNNQNFVRVGDWVSRGDTIAEVGSTGRATGPHVHFEVKF
ncbi:MAG TPA: peptidoglycan DD-metalloendopeptidase family protein [Terriglobia bacterium]|nr:peptidoglycan DD-metalloendopeptidase family protein [Terriglobia bacterium]